jgi:hypothetical protein
MISMYSDAALEQPFDDRTNVRPIKVRRETGSDPHDSSSARLAPSAVVTSGRDDDLLNSKTLHHDSLDVARGILLAVVLGLGCWIVLGGIVRIVFF